MKPIRRVLIVVTLLVAAAMSVAPVLAAVHRVPVYGGRGHGGHGHGGHGHGHGGHGHWHGGGGWYGGGWYAGFYWPYYGPYYYGYYGPPYPYYPAYGGYYGPGEGPDFAVVDCDVDPEEAKVYLDGERLGEADDFDGYPQYLTISPGEHVIEFRRTGYQTLRLEINAKAGRLYGVDRKMFAGDIKGKPRIERWGAPNGNSVPEDEEDMEAPQPPRTHHYSEKPRPKVEEPKEDSDVNGDNDEPSEEGEDSEPRP